MWIIQYQDPLPGYINNMKMWSISHKQISGHPSLFHYLLTITIQGAMEPWMVNVGQTLYSKQGAKKTKLPFNSLGTCFTELDEGTQMQEKNVVFGSKNGCPLTFWIKFSWINPMVAGYIAGVCNLDLPQGHTGAHGFAESRVAPLLAGHLDIAMWRFKSLLDMSSRFRVTKSTCVWQIKLILVGGLEHFFHNIWDNPSQWPIFFRGVETTNQYYSSVSV